MRRGRARGPRGSGGGSRRLAGGGQTGGAGASRSGGGSSGGGAFGSSSAVKGQRPGSSSRGSGNAGSGGAGDSKAYSGAPPSDGLPQSGPVCASGPSAGRGSEGRSDSRGEGGGSGDEFRTTGHELIGARVRRMLLEAGAPVGCVDGTVTGWLPAEESDFVSELTRDPAALWHVRFDTDEVGSEDLEEFEVHEAVRTFRSQTSQFLIGQRVWRLFPGIGELLGEVVKVDPGEGGEMIFEVAFDEDLSDFLPWDELHASLARGANSHACPTDAAQMSNTQPTKSPTLLSSGFRRFSDILPGMTLSHLVKPYDTQYSHSNSSAFAILSRFMPPAPQCPGKLDQQFKLDDETSGGAPALEQLKWIPETEEDNMEDDAGKNRQEKVDSSGLRSDGSGSVIQMDANEVNEHLPVTVDKTEHLQGLSCSSLEHDTQCQHENLSQGAKSNMDCALNELSASPSASTSTDADAASNLARCIQASWWSCLKGKEDLKCDLPTKPAVQAALKDCAETLRASWWLSLRSSRDNQGTSFGSSSLQEQSPTFASAEKNLKFGESHDAKNVNMAKVSCTSAAQPSQSGTDCVAKADCENDRNAKAEPKFEEAGLLGQPGHATLTLPAHLVEENQHDAVKLDTDVVILPQKRSRTMLEEEELANSLNKEEGPESNVAKKMRHCSEIENQKFQNDGVDIDCCSDTASKSSESKPENAGPVTGELVCKQLDGSKISGSQDASGLPLNESTSVVQKAGLSSATEKAQSSECDITDGNSAKIDVLPHMPGDDIAVLNENIVPKTMNEIKDPTNLEEVKSHIADDVVQQGAVHCDIQLSTSSDIGQLKKSEEVSSTADCGGVSRQEAAIYSGVQCCSQESVNSEETSCDTPSVKVEDCLENPDAELDEEAAEFLGGDMATLWINGALIRQERLPLQLEKDQAIECEDDGTVFQARVSRIDERRSRVLVHFLGWSARHDRWVPLNSRRIRVLPGGTKRDRVDTSSASNNGGSGESGSAPQQEERRTRTRTSVIMAQAAASGAGGASGPDDVWGPEAERRRFGGINSAGMHVPVASNDPMVSLLYSCNGVPAAAVGAVLAQLLTAAATKPTVQVQSRGGRSNAKGSAASGDDEFPISRECNWSGPDLQHGGLLGGVVTQSQFHRQQQRYAPPSRPQEQLPQRAANPLIEAIPTTEGCSNVSVSGTGNVASVDRALTVDCASTQLSSAQPNPANGQSSSPVVQVSGQSSDSTPSTAEDSTLKPTPVPTSCDSPAPSGANGSCRVGPVETRAAVKPAKQARSGKIAPAVLYSVGTAVEVRLDNGEWEPATITGIKQQVPPLAGNSSRLECRISFDQDDFVDLFLPNPCVRLVFTVGTLVEVRLDNGEWASAVITAVKKPANCDTARLVYRISFDQPDDYVDLCLPNDSVRLALTGSGNPAVFGKKGSGVSQRPASRQAAAVARTGVAQLPGPALTASPAVSSAISAVSAQALDKICDTSRNYVNAGNEDSAQLEPILASGLNPGVQLIAGAAANNTADGSEQQKVSRTRKRAVSAASAGGPRTTRTRARQVSSPTVLAAAEHQTGSGGAVDATGLGDVLSQSIQEKAALETASHVEDETGTSTENQTKTTVSSMAAQMNEQMVSGLKSAIDETASGMQVSTGALVTEPERDNAGSKQGANFDKDANTQQLCQKGNNDARAEAVIMTAVQHTAPQNLCSSQGLRPCCISSTDVNAHGEEQEKAQGMALISKDEEAPLDPRGHASVKSNTCQSASELHSSVMDDQVALVSPAVGPDSVGVVSFGLSQYPSNSHQSAGLEEQAASTPSDHPKVGGVFATISTSEYSEVLDSSGQALPSEDSSGQANTDAVMMELSQSESGLSQKVLKTTLDASSPGQGILFTSDMDKSREQSLTASNANTGMELIDIDSAAQETANILAASSAFLKWRAVEDSNIPMSTSESENQKASASVQETGAQGRLGNVRTQNPNETTTLTERGQEEKEGDNALGGLENEKALNDSSDEAAAPASVGDVTAVNRQECKNTPHSVGEDAGAARQENENPSLSISEDKVAAIPGSASVCPGAVTGESRLNPDCEAPNTHAETGSICDNTCSMQSHSVLDSLESDNGDISSNPELTTNMQADVQAKQNLSNPGLDIDVAACPLTEAKEGCPSVLDGTSAQTAVPPPIAA